MKRSPFTPVLWPWFTGAHSSLPIQGLTTPAKPLILRMKSVELPELMLLWLWFRITTSRIAHYTTVAASAQKPIIIYNIPGRTGVNMLPETVATLAQNPMIQGIKQCGSLAALSDIIDRTKHDAFNVWTGEDAQALTIKTLGGMGVISVASHLYAHSIREMYRALDRGDITTVAALQRQLLPKMAALFHFPSPAPTKAALNALGFKVGSPRLPLLPLTAAQQQELAHLLGVPELSASEAEVLA